MVALALVLLSYSPMAALHQAADPVYVTVRDESRKRDIPIKLYPSKAPGAQPIILFSHGLGGSREGSSYLGGHLAARGYTMIALQHPGSDESVWRGKAVRDVMPAMREAANGTNLQLRIGDVKAVLDWAEKETKGPGQWKGAFDMTSVGMCGHSFGAHTTQAVSGQSFPGVGQGFTDPRIKAAIAYSPSPPSAGSPEAAFGKVAVPWLLMTGTKDDSPIGNTTPADRLRVYPYLPSVAKGQLVLFDGLHLAFSDAAAGRRGGQRNPAHHPTIQALSTAFWDAHLLGSREAEEWLAGPGAQSALSPRDEFVYRREGA